ncbi:pyridoxamine 5'-phosphate oxidase family protein [Nonomuraea basaltis]|uniref:pyridoxamine 5'-phosphate oxidase family protein n=1 Tax=Nonomuraea basaltis TaxID=2495887 RepID=UPI00110C6890|nr:pyridoxamine 5'-phosphate oxidase family protein [Nonomuraea basaltis]TMR88977.1 pyridoxamine 5'-phosphate oxidase family protein [Nonomuraea basaltis]
MTWDGIGNRELEALSRPQCLALLGSVAVGRLGFTRAALPVIWPVDFLLHGECWWSATPG